MQARNPTPPPRPPADEQTSWRETFRATARATAGPVLLVWLIVSAGEILLAEWLADGLSRMRLGPWLEEPADARGFNARPFLVVVLPFLAAFRSALFRPAHRALRGEHPRTLEVAGMAFDRMLPVFFTRMSIQAYQFTALLFCLWIAARMPLWVLLPLGFTLAPAQYFVATREIDATRGLWTALEFSHRHWIAIFAAHGFGLVAILACSASGAMAAPLGSLPIFPLNTFSTLGILGGYLVGRYIDWLVVTATYTYLDPRA